MTGVQTCALPICWKMQSDVWGSISDQGVVTHITGGNFVQSSATINGSISYGHRHPR